MSKAKQRVAAARFTAEHWRDGMLRSDRDEMMNARASAHMLNMVLAALDGETDPYELGINEDQHEEFRRAINDT